MSTSFAILIICEVIAAVLVAYGFKHEKKLIAFEEKVKMIVVVNVRRYKRKKALMKQQELANKRLVALHTGNSNARKAPNRVA